VTNPHENTRKADALIGEFKRQSAGRLTVFLGASPGVGKTYAMLSRGRELQRQGIDVLIGIVETHGRQETQALVNGLPCLPRKRIQYQSHLLEEMDLDALLERRPTIALVDEMAHRNAPGSRHERRWQDIEELLNAGIDVYTTVNVQHLESLNDVVHQITGIRVTETVPDVVFDRLRDIRLVDLPARELIERLNQGKVYLPDQAKKALQAFFSPSNLTALRELAMQTVADQVDSDLREARIARGIDSPSIQRRVLIAIDGRGQSEYLVRAGMRIAERRGVPWTVVTVVSGHQSSSDILAQQSVRNAARQTAEQSRQMEIDKAFALARRLGGDTEILHNADVAQALLDASDALGVRTIVLGRTRERPIARAFNRTLTQRLIQHGSRYELTIVGAAQYPARSKIRLPHASSRLSLREMLIVILTSFGATIAAALAERFFALDELSIIFLVAVIFVASYTRMICAVITAIICFVVYDYIFIAPRFTLLISANQGLVTVILFMVAALLTGRLASKLRMQVVALRAANRHAVSIEKLGRSLSTAADLGQVIKAGNTNLRSALGARSWVRIGNQADQNSDEGVLSDTDNVAADWTQQYGQPSGKFTNTLAESNWWFLPVQGEHQVLGVIGLQFPPDLTKLTFEQRRLAQAMVEDIGQAAIRTELVTQLEQARVVGETERLRSALLSSVSHDLRSPLSSIIGASESLRNYGKDMQEDDRLALLDGIYAEGQRLDRYIQNLLDMTRLGHDGLTLSRDWIGVDELIGVATRRLKKYMPNVIVHARIAPDTGLIYAHPALLEQAIFNALENAAKFSPPDVPIVITAAIIENNAITIDIIDKGPGIPEHERRRVFDMFYSLENADSGKAGTGLGLTIVQAIVRAHMGTVEALQGDDNIGTTIRITLPSGA